MGQGKIYYRLRPRRMEQVHQAMNHLRASLSPEELLRFNSSIPRCFITQGIGFTGMDLSKVDGPISYRGYASAIILAYQLSRAVAHVERSENRYQQRKAERL